MVYRLVFSGTGRTKNVLDIISNQWDDEKQTIDLSVVDFDADKYHFSEQDFCILAVPVYGGRIPLPATDNLKKLNGNSVKVLLIAVFGNRAVDDCLLEMKDVMINQGFIPVAAIEASVQHSILTMVEPDRPDDDDISELKGFANAVKEALIEKKHFSALRVPGNFPYCEITKHPIQPVANELCTACGLCAEKCPSRAISADNPRGTDFTKCTGCMRCAALCPVGARNFPEEVLNNAYAMMRSVFEGRKPNKLYIAD